MSDSGKPVSARRLETQERLMDAAFEVCVEVGLAEASVEAICAAAGFSRGAFYSNFSSKEELFFALLAREYRRRTEDLESRMATFGEELSCRADGIGHDEAALFIREFFITSSFEVDWYVIEQEFLLLAMRDPELAPEYLKYQANYVAELAEVVTQIVAVAGRRFVIAIDDALPLLSSIYERELMLAVLTGKGRIGGASDAAGADGAAATGAGGAAGVVRPDAPDLGQRVADVLFAITAETPGA